jgi:predicted Zn-dependent protease
MLGTCLIRCAARRAIAGSVAASLVFAPMGMAQDNLPVFSGKQERKLEPLPQSNLPELGDPSQVALSGVQERKLGESVMRQIRASGGYLFDPEVNGYLNDLGNRLVTAIPGAPFDFEFFAMADPSINAFALPGGFVGVNTGLILLAQTRQADRDKAHADADAQHREDLAQASLERPSATPCSLRSRPRSCHPRIAVALSLQR